VAELTATTGAASANPPPNGGGVSAAQAATAQTEPTVAATPPILPPSRPQIAKVAPPPPPVLPPKPHVPIVAVLSGGDITVAEPAGRAIERTLARQGYHLANADLLPGTDRYVDGRRVDVPALLDFLARAGRIDAVVIVHARRTGAQNLPAYGMNVEATTAQLNVMTYAVQGRHKLGAGWTANVIYTGLSAKQQGEEAVEEITPQVEHALVEYRPRHGRD
jgi:hypothetical protein